MINEIFWKALEKELFSYGALIDDGNVFPGIVTTAVIVKALQRYEEEKEKDQNNQ